MDNFGFFYVYDYRRDRTVLEFHAKSDFAALEEFSDWYNRLVRPDRWEGRKLGRYWLFAERRDPSGELLRPRPVSLDENVRLSLDWFLSCDPPYDDTSLAACEAEFRRLDALDMARLLSRPANVFAEHLDDGKRRAS